MNFIEALSVFGLTTLKGETVHSLKKRYRILAKEKHPDTAGGNSDDFVALGSAYTLLKREINSSDSYSNSRNSGSPVFNKTKGYGVVDEVIESENPQTAEQSVQEKQDTSQSVVFSQTSEVLPENISTIISNYELHRSILEVVGRQVDQVSKEYKSEMNSLQTKYEKELEKLEHNGIYRIWVKLLSPLTGKDIWERYNQNIKSYEVEKDKIKSRYNQMLLSIYGESLNEMTKYLTSGV